MAELKRRSFLAGAAGLAAVSAGVGSSLLGAEAAAAAPAAGRPVPRRLPPKPLRGFGKLSADFAPMGPGASLLRIQCESAELARLTHAKYLSDLTRLPGVTATTLVVRGRRVPAYRTSAGIVAALTSGDSVVVLAADDERAFAALAGRGIPRDAVEADFAAQTGVPMYLERFDRYGLLIYFAPFLLPPGWDRTKPYDYGLDFDFIEQNELGVAVWDQELQFGTSEGMARVPDWSWVVDECARRGIPVHLNTQLTAGLWVSNRYREQTMQKMPQYVGYYGNPASYNFSTGPMSYSATTGMDAELGVLQETVRKYKPEPNVVGWLEPHHELSGAPPSVLLVEYGEVADTTLRTFLKDRYPSLAALGKAWHGDRRHFRSWDDVHVPEVASFLGWGPDAVDVAGEWRVLYPGANPLPAGWDQPAFDDSAWGGLVMPGSDRVEFLPRQRLVGRRTVEVSAAWLAAHPRVWLYLFDLNSVTTAPLPVTVNGHQTAGIPVTLSNHRGWLEVTGLLEPGDNLIALDLPNGYIGYRCYLSGDAPVQFPNLGAQGNTRWIDFLDWSRWSREGAVRRGVEMIRQEDPDRPIIFMSPDTYGDRLKKVAADYGGMFHNTGYAAGFWAEYHPLLSRSEGRPATAEPGNGAPNSDVLKQCWGRWISSGLNGIQYFQNQQEIMYKPDVLALFEANRAMYRSIGRYHVPEAEVAVLYAFRITGHTSFPWVNDPDNWLPGGYWTRNSGSALLPVCPRDGVTELDFADGTVDRYRVIVDSNTSVMDDALVDQIEDWVRDGGTFVTFVQTGRHSLTGADSWPVGRLTGYEVVGKDSYTVRMGQGQQPYTPTATHGLRPAPGQQVFTDRAWLAGVEGSGLFLKKVAHDAQDLLLWEDGTVAAGRRRLGKGQVIHLGCHFEEILDRDPAPNDTKLLGQVMDYLGVERVPGRAAGVVFRHFVSNTGLHDVWVLYNDTANAVTTDLQFTAAHPPTQLTELNSDAVTPVTSSGGVPGVYGITLGPWDMRLFLSPRGGVASSPLEWLSLQRDWWAGTTTPGRKELPTAAQMQHNTVDISDDWAFLPADTLTTEQIAAAVQPGADDSGWERRDLGIWTMLDHPGVQHAVLRKRFTIPAGWTVGETQLWLGLDRTTAIFRDSGRVYLDGTLIRDFNAGGINGLPANTLLPPGDHVIALDVKGASNGTGVTANAWIYHIPEPDARQDLGGTWELTAADGIHEGGGVAIPGVFTGMFVARDDVVVDTAHEGSNVVIYIKRVNASIAGVLVNGFLIGDLYPATRVGDVLMVDITNKVRFGEANRIELMSAVPTAAMTVGTTELRFYNSTTFP